MIGITYLMMIALSAPSRADTLPSIFVGATLGLTTTTVETPHYSTFTTEFGVLSYSVSREDQKVLLPNSRIDGYIMWSAYEPMVNLSSPTAIGTIKAKKKICFFPASDWSVVDKPLKILASTVTPSCLMIGTELIKTITPFEGRLSGSLGQFAGIYYMPPRQVELLRTKDPFYSCRAAYSDSSMWLSFNPQIGEKELSPICAAESPRSDLIGRILKFPDVFFFATEED